MNWYKQSIAPVQSIDRWDILYKKIYMEILEQSGIPPQYGEVAAKVQKKILELDFDDSIKGY